MKMLFIFLFTFKAYSYEIYTQFSSYKTDVDRTSQGVLQIIANSNSKVLAKAPIISRSAFKASKKFDIPLNVILAIAYVESSYRLGAVNSASNDYGIMQVNAWHVKRSGLDRHKLLSNLDYSFYHGVRIFSWFYRKYPLEEAIARYNCGTAKKCISWKSVKKYVDKVNKAM